MKKKISGILSLIFIFFASFMVTACGDKYEKMEFKVYYAYSQDATEWHDASDGISLNYGSKNGSLFFEGQDESGNESVITLYFL